MATRREKVIIDVNGLAEAANWSARMRQVTASMWRNDHARRESPLYVADWKQPGPQVWEGDDN